MNQLMSKPNTRTANAYKSIKLFKAFQSILQNIFTQKTSIFMTGNAPSLLMQDQISKFKIITSSQTVETEI